MRLKIQFDTVSKSSEIPVNYQYPLSAWIYRTIATGNHEFSDFLHNSGFTASGKTFRFFTFSQLFFPQGGFRVEGDRLRIIGAGCWFFVSFMVPVAVEHFIAGLFRNQQFTMGDRISQATFNVSSVEVLSDPLFHDEARFRCISPVLVSKRLENRNTAAYLAPEHPGYDQLLLYNLISKLTTAIATGLLLPEKEMAMQDIQFSFSLLNGPRKKGITVKEGSPEQTKIIGYNYDFSIKAPHILLRTGYLCGFGEKNSLGLGCVNLIH